MRIHVKDGTPSGQSLCETCRYSQRIGGFAESERVVLCQITNSRVQMKVATCSLFVQRGTLTFQEMDQIAWVIEVGKSSGVIGFLKPEERRKAGDYTPSQPSW